MLEGLREHLPSAAVDILHSVLSNGQQPLEHRAPIVIEGSGTDATGNVPPTVGLCNDDAFAMLHVTNSHATYSQTTGEATGGWGVKFDGPVNICPAAGSEAVNVGLVAPGATIGDVIVTGDIIIEGDIITEIGGPSYAALPTGTVILWALALPPPSGWALMDGNDNQSGINMTGYYVRGLASAGSSPDGEAKGSSTHTHGTTGKSSGSTALFSGYTGYTVIDSHVHKHSAASKRDVPIFGDPGEHGVDVPSGSWTKDAEITHDQHRHPMYPHSHELGNHTHSMNDSSDLPSWQELYYIEKQ